MTITNITPIGSDIVLGTRAPLKTAPSPGANFAAWIDSNLGEANDKLIHADRMVQKLALGEVDNLHQVMIALDEAKFSFNLLVQVRNKLLEAYQDVMRMQI